MARDISWYKLSDLMWDRLKFWFTPESHSPGTASAWCTLVDNAHLLTTPTPPSPSTALPPSPCFHEPQPTIFRHSLAKVFESSSLATSIIIRLMSSAHHEFCMDLPNHSSVYTAINAAGPILFSARTGSGWRATGSCLLFLVP